VHKKLNLTFVLVFLTINLLRVYMQGALNCVVMFCRKFFTQILQIERIYLECIGFIWIVLLSKRTNQPIAIILESGENRPNLQNLRAQKT
jgi:hypothetical protein